MPLNKIRQLDHFIATIQRVGPSLAKITKDASHCLEFDRIANRKTQDIIAMSSAKKKGNRFSDRFGLLQSQAELDFVDIPVDADLKLFCDPYSFVIESDPWFVECNNEVSSFFQRLLDFIRARDRSSAMQMLEHVGEANEAHLGFSEKEARGLGIGRKKAEALYERLQSSDAVKTGRLQDISECDLFVRGVGPDNISDMTLNIIRHKLLEYTATQCEQLGIETKMVQGGFCWNNESNRWKNGYAHLPVVDGNRLLLVPKAAVRYRLALDHQDFYRKHVLEFLQAEHLSANTSLVHVLKNGKRRVTKKDVAQENPLSKEMLFRFAEEHPEVLKAYKESAYNNIAVLRDEDIEGQQRQQKGVDIQAILTKLDQLKSGHEDASKFHDAVFGAMHAIFYPQLRMFKKEAEINEGRKRLDIIANNSRAPGFFSDLASQHNILCPYIAFECKNYTEDPRNPEFDQLSGRLNDQRGKVGVLICRHITDRPAIIAKCKDYRKKGELLIVLDDQDLKILLGHRKEQAYGLISEYMHKRLREIEL